MTKYYRRGYPRPQFVREQFVSLNGAWRVCFDPENRGEGLGWFRGFASDLEIRVPFSYESPLSGIGRQEPCAAVWYQREQAFPHAQDERVLLYFEGCDYHTRVWVNGLCVGEHEGGYTRFCFDITDALQSEAPARIVVCARDSLDAAQPRGKQRWLPESYDCWYIQTTGIWKDVWAETVNRSHLEGVKITPLYDEGSVRLEASIALPCDDLTLETVITFGDEPVYRGSVAVQRGEVNQTVSLAADFAKWKLKFWSPKSPNLYDVHFALYRAGKLIDAAGSYFGLRKFAAENGRISLNNMHVYLRMVLDQGYWQDGHLTPPDEDALLFDLRKLLEYGYNGVRKHQKIEDERFYYWADVLGVLVWCEMPSTYEYNHAAIGRLTAEWSAVVRQLYNHPSIVTWVPFNESWGLLNVYHNASQQQLTEALYHLTKAYDPHRPVIVNDGWEHTVSDILTLHDYAQQGESITEHWRDSKGILENRVSFHEERYAFAKGYAYRGQPIMISEFGGVAYKNGEQGWGYGKNEEDEEAFLTRLGGLFSAIYGLGFLCGFCYTQLADVQQEQNGHMDEARHDKTDSARLRAMVTNGEAQ